MKKILFGAILFFYLISPFGLKAQSTDSLFKRDLLVATFKVATTLDTNIVTIDSFVIMISPNYGKIWIPGDQKGFTFVKRNLVWVLILDQDSNDRIKKIDPIILIGVLKKLKDFNKK